jgi:hypothetical protein
LKTKPDKQCRKNCSKLNFKCAFVCKAPLLLTPNNSSNSGPSLCCYNDVMVGLTPLPMLSSVGHLISLCLKPPTDHSLFCSRLPLLQLHTVWSFTILDAKWSPNSWLWHSRSLGCHTTKFSRLSSPLSTVLLSMISVIKGPPQFGNISKWKIPLKNPQGTNNFYCNMLLWWFCFIIVVNLLLCLIYKLNFTIGMFKRQT